ncbi:MAG: glycosyltransferase family 4 protein [Armatimonadota bacterium]
MHLWLVTVGEPLPIDEGARLLRTGMLAERLLARGHTVVWWTSTFHHQRKKHRFPHDAQVALSEGYEIRLLHAPAYQSNISLRRIVHQRVTARKFATAAEQERPPDIIVCSYPTIELASACTRYGRRHGVPVIIDIRDLWPDVWLAAAPKLFRPIAQAILQPMFSTAKRVCRDATGLVAVSKTHLSWGLRNADRLQAPYDVVFPLGYDDRSFRQDTDVEAHTEQARRRFGIRPDAFVALFIGTFGFVYDLDTVIDAARMLDEKGGRIQIVLAGDGPRSSDLRRKAEDLGNVVFTGWLTGRDLRDLMRLASVGLGPFSEGAGCLPNKPFEYMAAGLPIISSLPGELEEILHREGVGIRYTAGDAKSLADAIKRLAEHPEERQAMAVRSRELFERQFSADIIYPRYVQFLEQVVRNAGRSPREPAQA